MSKSKQNAHNRPIDEKLPLDTIHHLLSAHRRRYSLYCLYLYENPVRLPDMAEQVTKWEQSELNLEDRLRTYNDLYHCHIPKLADAAVVAYCQDEDTVELAENAAQLRPNLEQAAETDLKGMDSLKL